MIRYLVQDGVCQARRNFFRRVIMPRPARPEMPRTNVEGSGIAYVLLTTPASVELSR